MRPYIYPNRLYPNYRFRSLYFDEKYLFNLEPDLGAWPIINDPQYVGKVMYYMYNDNTVTIATVELKDILDAIYQGKLDGLTEEALYLVRHGLVHAMVKSPREVQSINDTLGEDLFVCRVKTVPARSKASAQFRIVRNKFLEECHENKGKSNYDLIYS